MRNWITWSPGQCTSTTLCNCARLPSVYPRHVWFPTSKTTLSERVTLKRKCHQVMEGFWTRKRDVQKQRKRRFSICAQKCTFCNKSIHLYSKVLKQSLDLSSWWKSPVQFEAAYFPHLCEKKLFLKNKAQPLNHEMVLKDKSALGWWATSSQKRQGRRP